MHILGPITENTTNEENQEKKDTRTNYVSPDGGETVYQQLPNGEKILVEQTQKAKDNEQAFTEIDMVGTEAIELRRKYPALQKAWDRYLTVWHLIHENHSDV